LDLEHARERNIQAAELVSSSSISEGTKLMAESKSKEAIALLKEDHREVEKLFKEFESAKGEGRKQKLAHQICLELMVHSEIEESIFYPACEGTVDEDELKEGYVEHDAAKLMIAEIEANEGGDDEFFDTKVHVLQEEIEHHIKEEEGPAGIFSQARKGKLDLDLLGEQLAERKKELTELYKSEGLPQPKLTTMDEVSV
jgi:hemerythrin superfamily protein